MTGNIRFRVCVQIVRTMQLWYCVLCRPSFIADERPYVTQLETRGFACVFGGSSFFRFPETSRNHLRIKHLSVTVT
jgi:hypothetical protein